MDEDRFLCTICLDVFTDPVSTPCGHNFCKRCISEHWNLNAPCQCPNCRKVFTRKPELKVNTFISEMAARYRADSRTSQRRGARAPSPVTGTRLVVLTSCLVCLLCMFWMLSGNKAPDPTGQEHGDEAETEKTDAKFQEMWRRVKMVEIKDSVELYEKDGNRIITDGVQFFVNLMQLVEQSQAAFVKAIKQKQKKMRDEAEGLVRDGQREAELPHNHLVLKNWTDVKVRRPSYKGTLASVVAQLDPALALQMKNLFKMDLKRVQQHAVNVTLDPDTAHPQLVLSDNGKQVHLGDVQKNLTEGPDRFVPCISVLAKQKFPSGKFYYEVDVRNKTEWSLGVAKESINRKGEISLIPQNGYWTMWLKNDRYEALGGPSVPLSPKSRLQKVGVFVDYEEGLVSFYDVDAPTPMYSFTGCNFAEKLYPFFSPGLKYEGRNSAPLVISTVE